MYYKITYVNDEKNYDIVKLLTRKPVITCDVLATSNETYSGCQTGKQAFYSNTVFNRCAKEITEKQAKSFIKG